MNDRAAVLARLAAPGGVILLAFALRVVALDAVPPGWRDDEVIETTVHAQRVLDGELPLWFPEAEGHEPLYHYVSAVVIRAVGLSLFSVRLVSAFFGVLSVAATYRVGRQLFGRSTALLAATLLAVSFWSLMYSRTKTRHVSELVFALLAFSCWWEGARAGRRRSPVLPGASKPKVAQSKSTAETRSTQSDTLDRRDNTRSAVMMYLRVLCGSAAENSSVYSRRRALAFSGVWLALGLYAYSAAATAPVIVGAAALYFVTVPRLPLRRLASLVGLPLAVAGLLYLPLFISMRSSSAGAERLAVVGGPLRALATGDPRPALETTLGTLGMFAMRGDPEALYNVPERPAFGAVGFAFFLGGVVLAVYRARDARYGARYGFLILWLLIGLAPAFLSVPAASFGHTITAQPAVYLLAALPVAAAAQWLARMARTPPPLASLAPPPLSRPGRGEGPGGRGEGLPFLTSRAYILIGLSMLLLAAVATRDLPAYFRTWPDTELVRFLYRADLQAALRSWRTYPPVAPVAVGSSLSVWDARAAEIELAGAGVEPRWYRPGWAYVFPHGEAPTMIELLAPDPLAPAGLLDFGLISGEPLGSYPNMFELSAYSLTARDGGLAVNLSWTVDATYDPPQLEIGANPQSPAQPLMAFVHLLDAAGQLVAGADRFDVDAFTLQPGDRWVQLHWMRPPADLPTGTYSLSVGLYDPVTGVRLPTTDGRDAVPLGSLPWPEVTNIDQ